MRKALLAAALLLAPAGAFPEAGLRPPVDIPFMGFQAKLADGRVLLAWKRYKRDDFSRYYILRTEAKDDPMYPGDPVVFSSDVNGDTRYEDGKLAVATFHYRLVIVTRFGDRWASPVVAVAVGKDDLKRAPPLPTDFE